MGAGQTTLRARRAAVQAGELGAGPPEPGTADRAGQREQPQPSDRVPGLGAQGWGWLKLPLRQTQFGDCGIAQQGVKGGWRQLVDQRRGVPGMGQCQAAVARPVVSLGQQTSAQDRVAVVHAPGQQALQFSHALGRGQRPGGHLHRQQPGAAPDLDLGRAFGANQMLGLLEQCPRCRHFALMQRAPGPQHDAGLPAEAVANALEQRAAAPRRCLHLRPARLTIEVDRLQLRAERGGL